MESQSVVLADLVLRAPLWTRSARERQFSRPDTRPLASPRGAMCPTCAAPVDVAPQSRARRDGIIILLVLAYWRLSVFGERRLRYLKMLAISDARNTKPQDAIIVIAVEVLRKDRVNFVRTKN